MQTILLIDGNNVFRRLFEKLGTSALTDLYTQSISPRSDYIIAWIWDGRNSKARRQSIFPSYKNGRSPASDEFYHARNFFKELLTHSSCLNIECDGWEADDVIATMARDFAGQVIIHSNDADFFALVGENVTLHQDKIFPAEPKDMRLFKALCGDPSDNIKGIPRFGAKAFEKLSVDQKSVLIECLNGHLQPKPVTLSCDFTPAVAQNFVTHIDDIRAGWQIIRLLDVPEKTISDGLTVGKLDPQAAQHKLASVYQETEDLIAKITAQTLLNREF